LIAFSELISNSLISENYEAVKRHLNVLNRSAEQTYSLLVNLLEWARCQTGNIKFEKKQFNIEAIIDENIQLFEGALNNKKINLQNHVEKNTMVYADLQMIDTVIRNLISNAIKFTETDGEVTIHSKKTLDDITISINDTGVGIEPKRIETIFSVEKNKSTPGTSKESGTGLGLMICKEFIDQHGGRIWIESKLGKGSEISFAIPLK